MILFFEDTRRTGVAGFLGALLVCGLLIYFRWPPNPGYWIFVAIFLAAAAFYVYLIWLGKRRVVTLLDGELLWNTASISDPLYSVRVADLRAYKVKAVDDGPGYYYGSIRLGANRWYELGKFTLAEHQRIFSAISELNLELIWQLEE